MNFLGMGPAELVVIIVIALIVLGPGKLPEVARAFGKTMRNLRAISDEFQRELNRELNTVASVKDEVAPLSETLSSLRASLNDPVVPAQRKPAAERVNTAPATGAQMPQESVAEALPLLQPADEPASQGSGDELPVEYAGSSLDVTDQTKAG